MAGKFEFLKDGNISFDDLVRVRVDDDNNVEYPEDVFGRSFPLRQIAPGAVEFMVSQNRLTVPQRRSILGFLKNEDIKPTDAAAFYEFYFDIVEAHPVKAAFLEIGAISATKTNPRKINNKPVGALPLSERSDA